MSEIEPVTEGSAENEPNRTNPNLRSSVGSESSVTPLIPQLQGERDGLTQELNVLRLKLEHSEQRLEATRRECEARCRTSERAESEVNHLRGMNTQQGDTIQNLTEEIKGLTIALHHEQGQRRQLEAHVEDTAEDEEPKKPGFLRRAFTGKPKRKRKGKFARVGPS
jgi:chromosome segregation ATPase